MLMLNCSAHCWLQYNGESGDDEDADVTAADAGDDDDDDGILLWRSCSCKLNISPLITPSVISAISMSFWA